jgi:phosphate transport system protein
MSRPLDVGIAQIKSLLLKMGYLTQEALEEALMGFFVGKDVHIQVKAWSNTILMLSEEVEDRATELMALHQPMAGDLRTLKAYIKIAYDIERYGRYAMDISDIRNRIGGWEPIQRGDEDIKLMAEKVKDCVDISIKFIETRDEKLIWELSKKESETDDLYLKNLNTFTKCEGDPKTIIANLLTVRYLERIADHSSYISESISYAETGKRVSLR